MRARIRTVDSGVGLGVTPVYFVEVKRWWHREWRRVSQVTEYADAYRIALEYVAPQLTEVTPGAHLQRLKRSSTFLAEAAMTSIADAAEAIKKATASLASLKVAAPADTDTLRFKTMGRYIPSWQDTRKEWRDEPYVYDGKNAAPQGGVAGAGTARVAAQQGKNDAVNQYATGYSYKIDPELVTALAASQFKDELTKAVPLPTEGTPPAPGSPWPGHGGYYVCTVYGQHLIMRDRFSGVMASVTGPTFDLHTDKPFSNSHKEGKQNTRQQLMRGPQRFPAAQLCAGLILARLGGEFDDYYLPARAELQIAWAVAPELFERDRLYTTSTLVDGGKMFVVDGTSGAAYEVSCSSSDLVVVPFRSESA